MTQKENKLEASLAWERKFSESLAIELGKTTAAIIGFKIVVEDQEKIVESLLDKLKVYEQDSKLSRNNVSSLIKYKVDKID